MSREIPGGRRTESPIDPAGPDDPGTARDRQDRKGRGEDRGEGGLVTVEISSGSGLPPPGPGRPMVANDGRCAVVANDRGRPMVPHHDRTRGDAVVPHDGRGRPMVSHDGRGAVVPHDDWGSPVVANDRGRGGAVIPDDGRSAMVADNRRRPMVSDDGWGAVVADHPARRAEATGGAGLGRPG